MNDDDDVDGDNDDDDGGDDFPPICTKRSYVAGLKALALASMCPLVDFLIRRHMGFVCLSSTLLERFFSRCFGFVLSSKTNIEFDLMFFNFSCSVPN